MLHKLIKTVSKIRAAAEIKLNSVPKLPSFAIVKQLTINYCKINYCC